MRTSLANYVVNCTNVTVKNAMVYQAAGSGLMGERCENVRLDHFDATHTPGGQCIVAVTGDAMHWFYRKSDPTDHIEIRHNIIKTVNPDTPVFAFHPLGTGLKASHGYFSRNITIADNRIETASGRVVDAWLTESLDFSGNRITVAHPEKTAAAQAFRLRKVCNVQIHDNRVESGLPLTVAADRASRGVELKGNIGPSENAKGGDRTSAVKPRPTKPSR